MPAYELAIKKYQVTAAHWYEEARRHAARNTKHSAALAVRYQIVAANIAATARALMGVL